MKYDKNIDIMLADLLVRITVLEKLLINKNIVSLDEIISETKELTIDLAKKVLQNANINDIDSFINDLQTKKGFEN